MQALRSIANLLRALVALCLMVPAVLGILALIGIWATTWPPLFQAMGLCTFAAGVGYIIWPKQGRASTSRVYLLTKVNHAALAIRKRINGNK